MSKKEFDIAGHRIGRHPPPFIIAEVSGSDFAGRKETRPTYKATRLLCAAL